MRSRTRSCMDGSNITQRPRPSALAWYIAVSASRSRLSAVFRPLPSTALAMPTDAATTTPPAGAGSGASTQLRMASASAPASACVPGCAITNSSPPTRASVAPVGHGGAQPLGDLDDDPVAGVVPPRVVDELEPVQVEEVQPERFAGPVAGQVGPPRRPAAPGWAGRSGGRGWPGTRTAAGRRRSPARPTPRARAAGPPSWRRRRRAPPGRAVVVPRSARSARTAPPAPGRAAAAGAPTTPAPAGGRPGRCRAASGAARARADQREAEEERQVEQAGAGQLAGAADDRVRRCRPRAAAPCWPISNR